MSSQLTFESPLLRPTSTRLAVSVLVNSKYPLPSRMTLTLAAPASHPVVEAVLVSVPPVAEAPTTFVHATGSSARAPAASVAVSNPIAERQRRALRRREVLAID